MKKQIEELEKRVSELEKKEERRQRNLQELINKQIENDKKRELNNSTFR